MVAVRWDNIRQIAQHSAQHVSSTQSTVAESAVTLKLGLIYVNIHKIYIILNLQGKRSDQVILVIFFSPSAVRLFFSFLQNLNQILMFSCNYLYLDKLTSKISKGRAIFKGNHTGPPTQKGPTPGLMCGCHHLEILHNFYFFILIF